MKHSKKSIILPIKKPSQKLVILNKVIVEKIYQIETELLDLLKKID